MKTCDKLIVGSRRYCKQTAVGFAVFECETDGMKSVLPIGWRCDSHRKVEITMPELHKAREDFRQRLGKEPGKIQWGLSDLNPEEVEILIQAAREGAPVAERTVPVDRLGASDLKDVPGFDARKHRVQ